MIEVSGLSKTFRVHKKDPGFWGSVRSLFYRRWVEKWALKDIDLRIGEGEIVGLVGANGAGKTTLVKILSGIIHPTSGQVRVLGFEPWERDDRYLRQIALIMGQKAQLWWDLPAADSFELLKEIYEIDPQVYKKNLHQLVEMLSVGDQMNIAVRRLSLGERMKMELIASLLHQPKVIFLDEPTIGLDLTAQRSIRKFIDLYRKEHKPAMILTSHYMEDIEHLCKRIVVFKDGQKVYDGPLDQVIQNYVKDRVITFSADEGVEWTEEKYKTACRIPGAQLVSVEPATLKVRVPREKSSQLIQAILQATPVRDIDLAEEDISNVIETMIRKGHANET